MAKRRARVEELEPRVLLSGDLASAQQVLNQAVQAGLEISAVQAASPSDVVIELRETGLRLRIGADPARSLERWQRLRAELSPEEYGAHERYLRRQSLPKDGAFSHGWR